MKTRFFISLLLILSSIQGFTQETSARGLVVAKNNKDTILRNLALVVGISSYPNINRLLYADDDAYSFAEYLTNQKICAKNDITLLVDSAATKANFFKELRKLLDKSTNTDRVFIYFAGHGDVENDIESGFLLTYNCEPTNYPATDAIDISMLEKFVGAFTKKNAKVILITDACRSGNLAGGMAGAKSTLTAINSGFQNVIKILSCQPNQLSQEKKYPDGGHGVFTYHLIDGLSGLADKDNDQYISLRELDRYLDEVGEETNQQQIPKTEGDPQIKIASFNQELKMALLARKGNNAGYASNTNKRRGIDTSWSANSFFQLFNTQLRKNKLIEPALDNAWHTILSAEKARQPSALISDMKLELAAILEDEAQKFINQYLRGSLSYDQQTVLTQLQQAITYIETVETIIGKDDFRYNEFHVKKLFLDAYSIFRTKNKEKYNQAVTYLLKANELNGYQAWIYNALGLLYEDLKQPALAEKNYQKAIQLAPQWSYPWNNLGMLYWNLDNYTKGEMAYRKSLEIDSTYGYAWNGLGNILDDTKRYDEAIAAYQKSIAYNPLDANPWNGLGNVYSDLDQNEKAEAAYRQAIKINDKEESPWNGLGNVLCSLNKIEDAVVAYGNSIRCNPNYIYPYNNLALIKENQGNTKEAEKLYKQAIEIDSTYIDAWKNLGDLLIRVNPNEAIAVYKKVIRLAPDDADCWNGLGIAYKKLDDYDEAEASFKKGITIDSTNKHVWFNLGIVYYNKEDFQAAASCFKKTVLIDPANQQNWDYLMEMLERINDKKELYYWYQQKLVKFPTDETALIKLGYLSLDFKEFVKALDYFEKGKPTDENDPFSYMYFATAYSMMGKLKEALDYLELAFQKGYSYFDYLELNHYLDNIRNEERYKALLKKYRK